MKKNFFKKLALVMALTLAVGSVPATNVEAAAAPAFKSVAKGANLVEGQTKNYGIANVSAWSVKKIVVGNKKVATVVKSGKTAKITGVAEGKTTVRADLKAYKTKRTMSIRMKVNVKALTPEATGVSAPLAKTIKVSGVALNKFTLADVAVTGYNVLSYTAEADGKTATIVLDRMMVPNTEIEVKVADFTGKVTYKFEVAALSVVEGVFDDDLSGQTVKFTVNGETVEAQDLVDNGYAVSFVARDSLGRIVTNDFFADPFLGVIKVPATHGGYSVNVSVSNGTTVVTSEYATVKITDLHASINSIDEYDLMNSTSGFYQNSTTLLVGETATFDAIYATVDGVKWNNVTPGAVVTSSNPETVAVNGLTLTAAKEGQATVTITYGNVKKALTFNVNRGTRNLTTAVAVKEADYTSDTYKTNSKTIVGSKKEVTDDELFVVPLDQYGDPMKAGTAVYAFAAKKTVVDLDTSKVSTIVPAKVNASGVAVIPTKIATGANTSANIIVLNRKGIEPGHQTARETLLTFVYNVSSNNTADKDVLEIVPADITESDDNVLELYGDKTTTLKIVKYNKEGLKVGFGEFKGGAYEITTTNEDVVTVAAVTTDVTTAAIKITGCAAGTATVSLVERTTSGSSIISSIFVTVTDKVPGFGSIAYKVLPTIVEKDVTVDYKTFLDITPASGTTDDIVNGVSIKNLPGGATSYVRISKETNGYLLYLDRNDDGDFTSPVAGKLNDIALGWIELDAVKDSSYTFTMSDKLTGTTNAGSYGAVNLTVYAVDSTGTKVTTPSSVVLEAKASVKIDVPNK